MSYSFLHEAKTIYVGETTTARAPTCTAKSNVTDLQLTWKLHVVGPIVNESTKQHLKISLKGLLETSEFLVTV
jgi:hypothetical protein